MMLFAIIGLVATALLALLLMWAVIASLVSAALGGDLAGWLVFFGYLTAFIMSVSLTIWQPLHWAGLA